MTPPLPAQIILRILIPRDETFDLPGTLKDLYTARSKSIGKTRADLWYWRQVLFSIPKIHYGKLQGSTMMIGHYFRTAIRNLKRSKGTSLINIIGLSLGMACCLLIVLYIQDELSYDSFHANADRIFRVVTSTSGDGVPTNANGTFGTGPAMKEDFPEIVDCARLRKMGQGTKIYIGHGDGKFYEERFYFADPGVLTVFTFPLLRGDASSALSGPNSMVITEQVARKYFGNDDPMGRILETDPYNTGEMMIFKITGIAQNVPDNSHFHFDFLASYTNQKEDLTRLGGLFQHFTYLLLRDASEAPALEAQFPDFLERRWTDNPWYSNHLQPLRKIHLHSRLRSEIEPAGNVSSVTIFSLVAVIVLLIASINSINLSTARSLKRAKEVGLRKVVGAQRKQLMAQFLGESLLVSLVSGIAALILTALMLPIFNAISDKSVTLRFMCDPLPLACLAGIIGLVGFIAGGYIALVLSGLLPAQILKEGFASGSARKNLREGLVLLQFILATILIIGTLTGRKQMRFIQTHDTGYNREEILVIPLNKQARAEFEGLRNELLKSPVLRNVTTSSLVPTRGSYHESTAFEGHDQNLSPIIYAVDENFTDTYGIPILFGGKWEQTVRSTTQAEFLISMETVTEAGYGSPDEALGKRVAWYGHSGFIKGIVPDMNIYSFHQYSYPMILVITPIEEHNYLSIRLDANRYQEALRHVQDVWNRAVPDYPLDYFFLDESFYALHRTDKRLYEIFQVFSLTAVFVACLGLFGLSVFTVEQKTKEIGIRKAIGASVLGIYGLLARSFLKWVLLANLAAWPLAYFGMRAWLGNFVYRTEMDIGLFILAGLLASGVALCTVSVQSIRAARANPTDSLRYE